MNLRDKFKNATSLTKCVDLADEHAINFAEWLPYNAYKESTCWRMYDMKDNEYTIHDLINEFKKEKKL